MSSVTDPAPALARARDKLIVALDFPTVDQARALVDRLGDAAVFYKIGLGLQLGGGDSFARELKARGKRVFLDYKYYDIEETMRNAVARAAELGVDVLTVHGTGNILRGAVAGRAGSALKLFCVTVLTNIEAADFAAIGYADVDVEALVVHRAAQAMEAGCDGVIASAREVARIKAATAGRLAVITPGIRPSGSSHGDQKRVATPGEAIGDGSDYLVVGRPITGSPDPVAAAEAIVREIAAAL